MINVGDRQLNVIIFDGVEWLLANDAAWYLSVSNYRRDRPVPVDYLRDLVRHGSLKSVKMSANMRIYLLDDLSKIIIRNSPGRHPKKKTARRAV